MSALVAIARWWLIIILCVCLGACSPVVSSVPMYTLNRNVHCHLQLSIHDNYMLHLGPFIAIARWWLVCVGLGGHSPVVASMSALVAVAWWW